MRALKVKGLDPGGRLDDNARRIVEVRLGELRSFAPRALDPSDQEALHDMRIAAKRLRYVLEITGPAFGAPAEKGADVAKGLQDLLGEIHDCDVMLPRVRAHLERLRLEDAEHLRESARGAEDLPARAARAAPNRLRYRGLEVLHGYLSARRGVLFEHFVGEWERLEARGFAGELLAGLSPSEPSPAAEPAGAAP